MVPSEPQNGASPDVSGPAGSSRRRNGLDSRPCQRPQASRRLHAVRKTVHQVRLAVRLKECVIPPLTRTSAECSPSTFESEAHRAHASPAGLDGRRWEKPVTGQPPPVVEDPSAGVADPARRREPAVLRVWASVELAIACAALVLIFVSVLWQVVSRFVPALNWPGVGELAGYSLIVLTFIMVGYLIGNNGHITIQIIDYVAKGRAMVVVKAVSAACTAVICALLVWEAYELIQ